MTAVTREHRTPATRVPALPACLTGARSTQMLVEMAHDLRSPLTAILTLAESLQSGRSGPLTPGQHKQLGLIYASALRLCETTSDTLEFARGEEGGQNPRHPFSVAQVLRDVRTTVLPMAEEKELNVRVAGPAHDRRHGEERALRRVLLNLTTNALKMTERGGVDLVVEEEAGDLLRFTVEDTGPGISPAALKTLWHPFRPTARGPHSMFSSSGLGLAICRKLVAQMGGKIMVASELGVGTRFSFSIPLPSVR
jgi:signal transduction histidine kinase